MHSPRKYLLLALACLWILPALAQVEFTLSVHTKEIGKKDQLQVTYEISGTDAHLSFLMPLFGKDWEVISGPQYGYQHSTINGVTTSLMSYVYVLAPKSTGRLKIPATAVSLQGKEYRCKEQYVTVKAVDHVDGAQPPGFAGAQANLSYQEQPTELTREERLQPGEDPMKKIRENLFVKVTPSKKKVYVGEPVLVTYKLFTRLRSKSTIAKQPGFSGCTVSEMTTSDDAFPRQEMLAGKKFNTYTFRRVQLFPLQAGVIALGQATVDNTITFLSGANDFRDLYYESPVGEQFALSLTTTPEVIEVMPLPQQQQPAAVGRFDIAMRLKKPANAVNETNALVVTVTGSGNFHSVTEPEIRWPENIYHFEASEQDSIDFMAFPLKGSRTYEIPFEVNAVGEYRFPPVSLRYFDPATQQYHSVESNPVQLQVTTAIKNSLQQSPAQTKGVNIRYLLIIIPLLFFLGSFVILKYRDRKTQPAVVATDAIADETDAAPFTETDVQSRLDELMLIQQDVRFYSAAAALARELLSAGKGDASLLQQVLQECNTVLYTPMAATSKKEVIDKLQRAMA